MPAEPLLMLVSDRRRLGSRELPSLAREAARAGVSLFQVREKDLGGRALLRLCVQVLGAVGAMPTRVLVNGRPDVARAAGAHGVQLPEEGLPVGAVRRSFPELLIAASRHSVEAALHAEREGADLVVLGPVFATPGKEAHALGITTLAEACRRLRVPVCAIGGIDPGRCREVREAGARGLAAIRPFLEGPLGPVVTAFRQAWS